MKTILFLFSYVLPSIVMADGTLMISSIGNQNISKLQIKEVNGAELGSYASFGGTFPVQTQANDGVLSMQLGDSVDTLEFKVNGTGFDYRGRVWDESEFTTISSRLDKKGNVLMKGTTAGGIEFKLTTDVKKHALWMEWDTFALEMRENAKTGVGTCEGNLYYSSPEGNAQLANIHCKSSGSLQNSIYGNQHELVSWIVHLNILPKQQLKAMKARACLN